MNVDLEKSIKAKLKQIAKFENKTPSVVLQNFFLERLLVRIAYSSYCDNFVLKGGLLLSKYRQTNTRFRFFCKKHKKSNASH